MKAESAPDGAPERSAVATVSYLAAAQRVATTALLFRALSCSSYLIPLSAFAKLLNFSTARSRGCEFGLR
jgi:hypothetical protein